MPFAGTMRDRRGFRLASSRVRLSRRRLISGWLIGKASSLSIPKSAKGRKTFEAFTVAPSRTNGQQHTPPRIGRARRKAPMKRHDAPAFAKKCFLSSCSID